MTRLYVIAEMIRVDAKTTRLILESLDGAGDDWWCDLTADRLPPGVAVGWEATLTVPVVVGLHPPHQPGKATKYPGPKKKEAKP
jgi:hypothetical protein